MKRNLSRYFEKLSTLLGFIVLFTVLSIISRHFLTYTNMMSVLRQGTALALCAIGMTYAIVSGGIDLSVGSVMALSGCVSALLMANEGMSWVAAVIIGLLTAIICGTVVGYFIAFWNIQPFIMSLIMMSLARGIALVLTNGIPVAGFPQDFRFLGTGWLLGIPFPVIFGIMMFIIFGFIIRFTRFGVHIYAVGGKAEAAYYAGINIKRVRMSVYMISAFLSGTAGIIMTSRMNSGQPILGDKLELDAIAAVVIGGTALSGGQGGVFGTVIGVLIIIFLHNGLNMLGVSAFWQLVAIGLVILVAVIIDQLRQRVRSK